MTKIIYAVEPLCGWCYGFSTLARELAEYYKDQLEVEIVAGGLWAEERMLPMNSRKAEAIKASNKRITALYGKTFGEAFYQRYISDTGRLDSMPGCKAITAVKRLAEDKVFAYTEKIQYLYAHDGVDMYDPKVYSKLAREMGIDGFEQLYSQEKLIKETREEFTKARALGVTSYPTLLLQHNGDLHPISTNVSSVDELVNVIDDIIK